VGLPTENTADATFKFGTLVRPGHRGIWKDSIRTGKYAFNPHCYKAEIVPTQIITLEWSNAPSTAEHLDRNLSPIAAKSKEGFPFSIDLHYQLHIPDTEAPFVISMVGTVQNLIDEILQAAIGNHFRDKLQAQTAVQFIEERQKVQEEAFEHIKAKIDDYHVETKGIYMQDIVMPTQITDVLQSRLVAAEQEDTYKAQEKAQIARQSAERARGVAENQGALATSEVNMSIQKNGAEARKAQADGEATFIQRTAAAKGLGEAEGYEKQVAALGQTGTTVINAIASIKDGQRLMPEVYVGGGGSVLDAVLGKYLNGKTVTASEQ
jgi:SPFH domain/Band 7 family protein